MSGCDNRGLRAILLDGDWVWLRHVDADGKTKDWAIRVRQDQANVDQVERRYGASIVGESGGRHANAYRRGSGVTRAVGLAEAKIHKGYTLLGGSPDLRIPSGTSAGEAPRHGSAVSDMDGQAIYVRFSGGGQAVFDHLSEALTRAAGEVEKALEDAGQRPPEVIVGHSPYSTVVLFGDWAFSIVRDARRATDRGNRIELKQGSVSGAVVVQPPAAPLATLLWLARVRQTVAGSPGRLDIVDEQGRSIDPSLREEADLLGTWNTDFETLRPALEYLQLVEQRIDLGALQAPVADNWF